MNLSPIRLALTGLLGEDLADKWLARCRSEMERTYRADWFMCHFVLGLENDGSVYLITFSENGEHQLNMQLLG